MSATQAQQQEQPQQQRQQVRLPQQQQQQQQQGSSRAPTNPFRTAHLLHVQHHQAKVRHRLTRTIGARLCW